MRRGFLGDEEGEEERRYFGILLKIKRKWQKNCKNGSDLNYNCRKKRSRLQKFLNRLLQCKYGKSQVPIYNFFYFTAHILNILLSALLYFLFFFFWKENVFPTSNPWDGWISDMHAVRNSSRGVYTHELSHVFLTSVPVHFHTLPRIRQGKTCSWKMGIKSLRRLLAPRPRSLFLQLKCKVHI